MFDVFLNDDNWFSSWDKMVAIFGNSLVFFVVIVALVRWSGKRTTSQLNNFDWIITVAVGSLAASGILLNDITVFDALCAIASLFLAQWVVTWLAVRSDVFARMVKADPTLLFRNGEYHPGAMRKTRVTKAEIDAALRQEGLANHGDAASVVLETDGSLSVIPSENAAHSNAKLIEKVIKRD